jgi:hypothetical protein
VHASRAQVMAERPANEIRSLGLVTMIARFAPVSLIASGGGVEDRDAVVPSPALGKILKTDKQYITHS